VIRDTTAQGLDEHLAARFETTAAQRDELLRIGLTSDESMEDRPPALAENIADRARDLDVGVFEYLLDPVRVRTTSRASCLRVRERSRTSWIGIGGTKLPRTSPCASRSESHIASLTSDFRPGTLRTCCAFARTNSNAPSRTCHTGFQYTPVASMTTCVHCCSSSHAESSNSAVVVVANERTSCVTFPSTVIRAHATTTSLCTSSPAHYRVQNFQAPLADRDLEASIAERDRDRSSEPSCADDRGSQRCHAPTLPHTSQWPPMPVVPEQAGSAHRTHSIESGSLCARCSSRSPVT
jgi:hypothetical protein